MIYDKHLPWSLYENGVVESLVVSFDDKKRIANFRYFETERPNGYLDQSTNFIN